jgi:GYD domain
VQTYWTVSPHDTVAVLDEPDDESATTFLLQVRSLEAVRTTTLRAYNRNEMSGIIERLGPSPGAWYRSLTTKLPELRFHALLSDGAREVRFERVAAG